MRPDETNRARAARLARTAELVLAGGLGLALLVRITVRDAWPGAAILHYASPLPVLGTVAVLLAALAARRGDRRRAALAAALGASLALASALTLRGPGAADGVADGAGGDTWRLATWNAGHPDDLDGVRGCWDALAPDLLVVVEAGASSDGDWSRAFPGLTARRLPGEIALVTRGDIEAVEAWPLGRKHHSSLVRVALDGEELDVVAVDLNGTPWRDREPGMAELARRLDALGSRRPVVLGDFNTPLDSAPFDTLRSGRLVETLAEAGRGWRATWPRWIPVLDIDHVLVGPELLVIEAEAGGCAASDHRPVTAVVRRP